MKTALLALVMLTGFALPAHAAISGANLSWDDCGLAGTESKTFACDVNTGTSFVLIGSYVAPEGSTLITGMEVVVDFGTTVTDMPSWWQFYTSGACRRTSLTASADFANYPYSACRDLWGAQATGGVTVYVQPFNNISCRSRLLMVFAWPSDAWAPVESGVEYYAFRIAITRDKTVGFGACGGCLAPVAILVSDIKLTQPAGVGDYRIQNSADRNYVSWQGGDPWQSCLYVPVRNSTWGAIKSQYH